MSTCSPAPQPSRRPIYLILFAALAAAAGNGISLIAFPWLVLQHNGSASDASIVAGAASLPLLLSTLIAGPLTDATGLRMTFLVLAIPMIAIGLASLRLSSLRELDESPGPGPGPT